MLKSQLRFIITIVLVLGLSISLQSLFASWSAPSVGPPGGNIDPPINTGLAGQTKNGPLTVNNDLDVSLDLTIDGEIYSNVLNAADGSINIDAKGWGMNFTIDDDSDSDDYYRFYSDGSEIMNIDDTGNLTIPGWLNGMLNGDRIEDGSIDSSELAADSVGSSEIVEGAVGTSEIEDGSLLYTDTDVDSVQRRVVDSCTAGKFISAINSDGSVGCETPSVVSSPGVCTLDSECNTNNYIASVNIITCPVPPEFVTYDCFNNYCRSINWIEDCGSTPYLFANISGNYFIENDVLATFWGNTYDEAVDYYENSLLELNDFSSIDSQRRNRPVDNYILSNNPSIEDGKLKLRIKEMEPEESHFDEIKLIRVLHNKDSELIVENRSNNIKTIKKMEEKGLVNSCYFFKETSERIECLSQISSKDNENLYANLDDYIELNIDIRDLKDKETYLSLSSWGSTPLPIIPDPNKASARASFIIFFEENGEYKEYSMVHPRELQTDSYISLKEAIDNTNSGTLRIKIIWTEKHWLDQISIITSEEREFRMEELSISYASSSIEGDVLSKVEKRDNVYSHIKHKDSIDLEFDEGNLHVSSDEKESYIFVTYGFYHGLRSYLYPELEIDDEWQEKIDVYVEELNNLK
jgi:hypothetical protein